MHHAGPPRGQAPEYNAPVDEQTARQLLSEAQRMQGMTAEPPWVLKSVSSAQFAFLSSENFDQEARVDRSTGVVRIDHPFADER